MTEQKTYVRKQWLPTDERPGASEFNRIEDGIELAHEKADHLARVIADNEVIQSQKSAMGGNASEAIDLVTAKYREIEYLADNSKVADVVAAFNQLLSVLRQEEQE